MQVPPRGLLAGLLIAALLVVAALEGPAIIGHLPRLIQPPGQARRPTPAPVTSATLSPAPTGSALPSPSLSPSTEPTPPAPAPATLPPAPVAPPAPPQTAALPGFTCDAQQGGGAGSPMTTARVGAQSGYDRFVIQFSGPVPHYEIRPQATATFSQNGGTTSVTLRGNAGLDLVLRNTSGAGTYTASSDFRTGFAELQEARLLSDYQGVVEWGLGTAHPPCYHAFVLDGPPRLVVDVELS